MRKQDLFAKKFLFLHELRAMIVLSLITKEYYDHIVPWGKDDKLKDTIAQCLLHRSFFKHG